MYLYFKCKEIKALKISLFEIATSALKRYLIKFKLEICVFWINTDISIITDIFVQLNISVFIEDIYRLYSLPPLQVHSIQTQ